MSLWNRPVQRRIDPGPDRTALGYHNDMRAVAETYETPERAHGWMELAALRRTLANPVSIIQLGIGAMQLAIGARVAGEPQPAPAPEWGPVASAAAWWVLSDLDDRGGLRYESAMSHTYELSAPWYSALAQAEALSLLARCQPVAPAWAADWPQPMRTREQALSMLVATLTGDSLALVADTTYGPVLQEYPTTPPAHVLNGWLFALLGLYDASRCALLSATVRDAADRALAAGSQTLLCLLPEYELRSGWTTYDLFPHPFRHVASPFYHGLHIELLTALSAVTGLDAGEHLDRWQSAYASASARAGAVSRKVAFRLVRPRRARRTA